MRSTSDWKSESSAVLSVLVPSPAFHSIPRPHWWPMRPNRSWPIVLLVTSPQTRRTSSASPTVLRNDSGGATV
ncbi:MAG: hypothetical protein AMJ62_14625 [Myxococcales bacterium SG8_38]|nr:MAG: hypothetical protein AMJ62_14625 [Myxococcales bacterium SG8_38]